MIKALSGAKWASASRIIQRLRHIRVENKWLKLLSLLLAFLLFAVSRQPTTYIRLTGVPLEFRGLSPGVELSGDVDQTVVVNLRGPRDAVRGISPNQLSVIANLTNKEPGERIIQLRPSDANHPDNIEILQIEPASIRLRLERTITKSVKIDPQYMGAVAPELELYGARIQPSSIEIEGPQSQVSKVVSVLTETVNLEGRAGNFRIPVDVETPHNSIRVKTPGPIYLSAQIGELRTTRRFNRIALESPETDNRENTTTGPTGNIPPVKTVDVELYGPKSIIDSIKDADVRVYLKTPHSTGFDTNNLEVRLPQNTQNQLDIKILNPSEARLKKQ